jgi:hypothetical protein
MLQFQIAMMALSIVEQVAKLYRDARTAAQQAGELTTEQEAELDNRAAAVFSSDAADPEQNA